MESPPSQVARTSGAATSSWLFWLGIFLYCASITLSSYLGERLEIPSDRPGQDPPWYFIRRHLIQDMTVGTAMLIGALIGAAALKRRRDDARSLTLFCFTIGGLYGWRAIVILMKTNHAMSPELATSSWPTLDSYFGDPVIWAGRIMLVVTALIMAAALRIIEARRA